MFYIANPEQTESLLRLRKEVFSPEAAMSGMWRAAINLLGDTASCDRWSAPPADAHDKDGLSDHRGTHTDLSLQGGLFDPAPNSRPLIRDRNTSGEGRVW